MSGFEEENPFAEPKVDNPFADPSVQKAVAGTGQANLEDYNPFDKQKVEAKNNATTNSSGQGPAVMNPTQELPPPYTQSGQQQISTADFQRRQEELERRARELERREEELRNAPHNVRQNNWPPVPSFCPFQPCFYQDINVDIPVEFQKIVNYLYYLWVAHASVLLANLIVAMLYIFVGGDKGTTFGLALIYFFLFIPASFLCWFRPAYKAFRDDSSFNFMVFFFVFFFQMLISILYTLGIDSTGSSGLILGFSSLSGTGGQIFVGVLMILVGVGFGLLALADFYLLVRIHKMYRSTGASMAKAQAEFTTGVMKNETVRQAAAEAAREGVRSQFASATAGQNQPAAGGNRY